MLTRFIKDPAANLDYTINWAPNLVEDDVIVASTWSEATGTIDIGASSFDDTTATVWLSGGELGNTYRVVNEVTTQAGRIDQRTLHIVIQNR